MYQGQLDTERGLWFIHNTLSGAISLKPLHQKQHTTCRSILACTDIKPPSAPCMSHSATNITISVTAYISRHRGTQFDSLGAVDNSSRMRQTFTRSSHIPTLQLFRAVAYGHHLSTGRTSKTNHICPTHARIRGVHTPYTGSERNASLRECIRFIKSGHQVPTTVDRSCRGGRAARGARLHGPRHLPTSSCALNLRCAWAATRFNVPENRELPSPGSSRELHQLAIAARDVGGDVGRYAVLRQHSMIASTGNDSGIFAASVSPGGTDARENSSFVSPFVGVATYDSSNKLSRLRASF